MNPCVKPLTDIYTSIEPHRFYMETIFTDHHGTELPSFGLWILGEHQKDPNNKKNIVIVNLIKHRGGDYWAIRFEGDILYGPHLEDYIQKYGLKLISHKRAILLYKFYKNLI